ncbi:MAG: nitronate monooxygenase [archaeon]
MSPDDDPNIGCLANSSFQIIQGGMGAGISGWRLARAVSQNGALGVVSGTAMDTILVRRLQLGDRDGHLKRAMENFPFPEISDRVYDEYYISGGKGPDVPFRRSGMFSVNADQEILELAVLANFVEVFLAKEGHDRPVGINYLEKIQMPHLPSIYGAMLAGVDYVLMGAGIPRQIPAILDSLSSHKPVGYRLNVENLSPGSSVTMEFDPGVIGDEPAGLLRPEFFAIVSSATLALTLAKKASGKVNGFIVEGPTAGGHNAPPRGNYSLNEIGEPVYGVKDAVELDKIASTGLPYWLAGGYGSPGQLNQALASGAAGIQVGTLFFLCDESDLDGTIKQEILNRPRAEDLAVYTDPIASPTGFPFKVLMMDGTNSEPSVYGARARTCDLGYLRVPYERPDGSIGYRCSGEPVETYKKKGGPENTAGRKCLCNGLMANIGLAQVRRTGLVEQPLLTAGNDINLVRYFLKEGTSYSAADVINYLTR